MDLEEKLANPDVTELEGTESNLLLENRICLHAIVEQELLRLPPRVLNKTLAQLCKDEKMIKIVLNVLGLCYFDPLRFTFDKCNT